MKLILHPFIAIPIPVPRIIIKIIQNITPNTVELADSL